MENILASQRTTQVDTRERSTQRRNALRVALMDHWPEYLMEGAELGLFMISACAFVVLLEYPTSPVHQSIPDSFLRRILIGIAMGLTAIGIIYSPLGQRSGAHFNPSVTLTFFRLGKVEPWDALFYTVSQFIGGLTGVLLSAVVLRELVAHPSVQYTATVPGMGGAGVAFLAEVLISFIQMSMVLRVSNTRRLARFTGVFAGIMVATYISLEAPYSGMSMNSAQISMISNVDANILRLGTPRIVPGMTLEIMANHTLPFWITTEDLPSPNNRVTLTENGGIMLSYTPNNEEAHKRLQAKLRDMLKAIGCHNHLVPLQAYSPGRIPLAGVAHQNGTCRMGHDPQTAGLDPNCKAHDLDNLYVVDGALFPSSGTVNPALTIMANALRVGDHLLERLG